MTWNPLDEPTDYIVLGGRRSPGLVTVEGANSPRKWDQRQGYGFSGATVVFKGIWLSAFKLTFRLYTKEDFERWEVFSEVLKKPPPVAAPGALFPPRPRALDIWHPQLEQLGITAVVVTDVKQLAQAAPGEWMVVIEVLEYRRPRLALSRPDGSTAQTNVDPVSQQIAANTQLIQELASQ